jgi:hypothetical protein
LQKIAEAALVKGDFILGLSFPSKFGEEPDLFTLSFQQILEFIYVPFLL